MMTMNTGLHILEFYTRSMLMGDYSGSMEEGYAAR